MSDSRRLTSVAIGLGLIGLGSVFLMAQLVSVNIWAWLWPFAIIGAGLLFFAAMIVGGRSAGPLAVPGSVITTIGLVLLCQNILGRWESWAYAWALIVAAVGMGMFIQGIWSGQEKPRRDGAHVAKIGFILFLVFGAFFELFIYRGYGRYSGLLWPVLLIGLGLYFILSQFALRASSPTEPVLAENTPVQNSVSATVGTLTLHGISGEKKAWKRDAARNTRG